jgi:hypothetical protein
MSILETTRNNTLNEFREHFNALAILLGDLESLSTSDKTSIVTAMNSLAAVSRTGNYSDLQNISINGASILSGTIDRNRLPAATTSAAGISQLADVLTDTSTSKTLTAAQGKILKDLIDSLTTVVSSKDDKWTVSVISTSSTLVNNSNVLISSAGTTQTLPSSPSAGNKVRISVMNFTNTIINRNNKKIMNLSENMTIDKANCSFELLFTGDTYGWWIVS